MKMNIRKFNLKNSHKLLVILLAGLLFSSLFFPSDALSDLTFRQEFTVVKVELDVNNTSSETDDYVVKEKPSGTRTTPVNTPAGATDNHIPMKVRLLGPTGFSAKVLLSDSGGGDVTIKKTDGNPYPAAGETVTVGTDLEVNVFGASASSALNDVTITAKTDKTGDAVCGTEDLTVIWVSESDMTFRGSAQQGQAITSGSTAKFTNFFSYANDKVGKFIYHKPTGNNWDHAMWQMEIKYQITPNVVISDVTWDIRREISRAAWGPGSGTLQPSYNGQNNWAPDDPDNSDEDLVQNANLKQIFEIDGPGCQGLPYTANYRFTYKGKFQDWGEVKIGTKWYVCSKYKNWRSIMHIKYQDAQQGWIEDASKTNEIVTGTISGWANSWPE